MRRYKCPAHAMELDHPTAAAWSFQEAAAPCLVCLLHHIGWAQDQHLFGQLLLSVLHQCPRSTAVIETCSTGLRRTVCVCGDERASPV